MGKSCYSGGMRNRIAAIEFMTGPGGLPMIGITATDHFYALPPPERVQYLIAATQVALRVAQQIAYENLEFEDEIIDMLQNIELEPTKVKLDS